MQKGKGKKIAGLDNPSQLKREGTDHHSMEAIRVEMKPKENRKNLERKGRSLVSR